MGRPDPRAGGWVSSRALQNLADTSQSAAVHLTITRRRVSAAVAVRWVLLAVYVYVFVRVAAADGIPFDRERLALWIVGALCVTCVGRPWRVAVGLVIDWVPFIGVFAVYDYSRGLADAVGMPLQVRPQIDLEKVLFVGQIPTVWLQEHLYTRGVVRWWDVLVAICYVTHFFAPLVVAGVLWARNRVEFHHFVSRLMTVSFTGVLMFVLFPSAPPWMASRRGEIGPVSRIATAGWSRVGLHSAASLVHKGQATFNTVAAIPSLHAAYAALIAAFFWRRVPARWRALLLVHPAAMLFTIVYGGEHYVVDALIGYLLVWGAFVLCGRIERWWVARRDQDQARTTTVVPTSAQP